MRVSTAVSLFVSAMALAACGGTAEETLNVASANNSICGLQCPTVKIPVVDDRNAPANTGNDESITADQGDTTIVLEGSVIANLDESNPAYSQLTENTKAKTAKIAIDPNTSNQASWPQPKDMELYKPKGMLATGLGGKYKEYRALTRNDKGTAVDEELQVWRWSHSYGTQYRDVKGGGEATHQAWSFGGTRTASAKIPTTGNASYAGQFGSTAKTFNWVEDTNSPATISKNHIWRVTGTSQSKVDFAKGNVTSTLTPATWEAFQNKNGMVGFLKVPVGACGFNCYSFMDDSITLKGKLTTGGKNGNEIAGRARLDASKGYVSGGNGSPFYGALFGSNAEEITGIFNVEATSPGPIGPDPINDDRRGFINHSGVFNGKKQ